MLAGIGLKNYLNIMQEGSEVDESKEPSQNEKVLDAAGFHP